MRGEDEYLTYIIAGKQTRFVIPVCQRNYDWKIEQCKRLFDDLQSVATTGMGGALLREHRLEEGGRHPRGDRRAAAHHHGVHPPRRARRPAPVPRERRHLGGSAKG